MNLVILRGNVGNDPLTKDVKGKMVCNFSLATKAGDNTDWHNVQAWEKTAELCSKYVEKGSSVLVQGRISYREY